MQADAAAARAEGAERDLHAAQDARQALGAERERLAARVVALERHVQSATTPLQSRLSELELEARPPPFFVLPSLLATLIGPQK